ncbi:DUF4199 domain-containing protein [Pontimicrobium sp. SW4]|uniref:DUF4199 domain-containing protein n=1 Tax=Pontimicrobium sp. SW4 TaxID=3153519 RepID=A0AAU7BTB2_9FLAO
MKKTVLKYGSYGLLTGVVLFLVSILVTKSLDYSLQEILGYVTMVATLSFIFFGIKHYRDKVNNGVVSFGKSLLIGLLISALVGVGVAIADYIYTTVVNPDFAQEYLDRTIAILETEYSGAELEAKKAELTQQMKDYGGSGFMATLMFVTVVIIGFIISLISGLILQRKN